MGEGGGVRVARGGGGWGVGGGDGRTGVGRGAIFGLFEGRLTARGAAFWEGGADLFWGRSWRLTLSPRVLFGRL